MPGTPLACDNHDFCDGIETCDPVRGCLPGTSVVCNDGQVCTDDVCIPATGQCRYDPVPGRACDDGNPCTSDDTCDAAGACRPKNETCCNNSGDDDLDGLTDCWDPDCETYPACIVPIQWCRLQYPASIREAQGTVVTVYGRFYTAGLTNRTPRTEHYPTLRAQVGYGPDGSDPTGAQWIWINATWNDGYDGTVWGEANNDEWMASLTVPAAGNHDYAYRFSGDRGATWLYCDLNAGPGADGSENGYQVINAGEMLVP